MEAIQELLPLYASSSPVRRLFIDEITAIVNWQKGMKRLLDGGELRRVLVVTTGSKASDLHPLTSYREDHPLHAGSLPRVVTYRNM